MKYNKIKVGDRYGMLTVIGKTEKRDRAGAIVWNCKCDCGNVVQRSTTSLQNSKSRGCIISCGCGKPRDIGQREAYSADRISKARESLGQIDGTTMQGINRMKVNRNNTSGHIGVSKYGDKWRARLMLRGKEVFYGEYDTKEKAVQARENAERLYFDPIRDAYSAEKGKYRDAEKRNK